MRNLQHIGRVCITALAVVFSGAIAAWSDEDDKIDDFAALVVPDKVQAAVSQIPDEARKLLALRSYLRSASILDDRWSWTEQQIADFKGTQEQIALQAEIDAIGARFSQSNPGYEIYVHSRVRSLETQLEHWNENPSVGVVADEIRTAWNAQGFDLEDSKGVKAAERWLKDYRPENRAPLAAPGLSRHGRAHAIDFQVQKDGEIVAPTDYSQIDTVWIEGHWEEKLNAAVLDAGPSFTGPLTPPHEPWHYDYDPDVN